MSRRYVVMRELRVVTEAGSWSVKGFAQFHLCLLLRFRLSIFRMAQCRVELCCLLQIFLARVYAIRHPCIVSAFVRRVQLMCVVHVYWDVNMASLPILLQLLVCFAKVKHVLALDKVLTHDWKSDTFLGSRLRIDRTVKRLVIAVSIQRC